MRFKKSVIFVLLAVFTAPAFLSAQNGKGNPVLEKKQMFIIASHGAKVPLTVECARTPTEQTYGLMFRESVGAEEGMLFVFDSDGYRNFWMKNTKIPLSIAYISAKGVILEIYDMKPYDISVTYRSMYPCRYALEVNQGWFAKKGIKPGSKVIFDAK
jgi:uncharacterized membrane protein (UPF0127 family)